MAADTLTDFINATLAGSAQIQAATQGRVFRFTTAQGTHTYPMIWWRIITDSSLGDTLCDVGQAWKAEVQVDVFTKDVSASARLAAIVRDAFNNAVLPEGILDSYSNEVVPAYADEDETIQYAVRVFINHKI